MLEYWYKDRRTLVDFRRGPLGKYFDGFAAYVKENGYSKCRGQDILSKACQFNVFLIDKGITNCRQVSRSLAEPFLDADHLNSRTTCSRYFSKGKKPGKLNRFFSYLEKIGKLKPVSPKTVPTRHSWLLDPYLGVIKSLGQKCHRN